MIRNARMDTVPIETISREEFFDTIANHYSVSIADTITMIDNNATLLEDKYVLYKTAKSIRPKTILEIGTCKGLTTLGLAENSQASEIFTIDVYAEMNIDIPEYQRHEVLPKAQVGLALKDKGINYTQVFGDSRNIATYSFLTEKIDFALIDGNHSFDAVIRDTKNITNFMSHNSIIFWHDFRDEVYIEIKMALTYLAAKKILNIYHIHKTWLAFSILG